MAHCFNYQNGALTSLGGYWPCGPVNDTTPAVSCCVEGSKCLGEGGGICMYSKSLHGGSGYYAGGCTDPSFSDPYCKLLCTDQSRPDVIYRPLLDLWACCGTDSDGEVKCQDPTNETFTLSPPQKLDVIFQVPITGFPYTSISISPTTSSSFSPMITSIPSPTGATEISKGAAAGIGVGASFGVVILGIAAWFSVRRCRAKKPADATLEVEQRPIGGLIPNSLEQYKHELPAHMQSLHEQDRLQQPVPHRDQPELV